MVIALITGPESGVTCPTGPAPSPVSSARNVGCRRRRPLRRVARPQVAPFGAAGERHTLWPVMAMAIALGASILLYALERSLSKWPWLHTIAGSAPAYLAAGLGAAFLYAAAIGLRVARASLLTLVTQLRQDSGPGDVEGALQSTLATPACTFCITSTTDLAGLTRTVARHPRRGNPPTDGSNRHRRCRWRW